MMMKCKAPGKIQMLLKINLVSLVDDKNVTNLTCVLQSLYGEDIN